MRGMGPFYYVFSGIKLTAEHVFLKKETFHGNHCLWCRIAKRGDAPHSDTRPQPIHWTGQDFHLSERKVGFKRAMFVSLLPTCDTADFAAFFNKQFVFPHHMVLTQRSETQPTVRNIETALQWATRDLRDFDSLVAVLVSSQSDTFRQQALDAFVRVWSISVFMTILWLTPGERSEPWGLPYRYTYTRSGKLLISRPLTPAKLGKSRMVVLSCEPLRTTRDPLTPSDLYRMLQSIFRRYRFRILYSQLLQELMDCVGPKGYTPRLECTSPELFYERYVGMPCA